MHINFLKSFAALSCLCFLAGCSNKESQSTPADIAAFSHPPPATAEQRAEYYQTMQDNFKREHPERFVDGKITGPGGTVSAAPSSAP